MERIGSLSIVPMIESAAGLLNAIDISRQASVLALAFGGLDYVRDLGVSLSEERTELLYPRAFLPVVAVERRAEPPHLAAEGVLERRPQRLQQRDLEAACTAGGRHLAALDTPWFDLDDEAGLLRDAGLARTLGFQGKLVIHPRQLEAVNRAFSPGEAELEWARRVVGAFEEASSGGQGATSLEGKMIDEANYRQAQDLLAQAEAIRDRGGSKG